ncbi:hypothetical protein FKM82_014727 [Ascaphus truei]
MLLYNWTPLKGFIKQKKYARVKVVTNHLLSCWRKKCKMIWKFPGIHSVSCFIAGNIFCLVKKVQFKSLLLGWLVKISIFF